MRIRKPEGGALWFMWNRKVLYAVLVCVGVLLYGLGHATGGSATTATPAPTATTTAEPTQDAPTYTPDPTTTTTAPPEDPHLDLMKTAIAFTAAWARPTLAASEWQAGIAPWVTPKLALELSTTDPARVPATRVIGEPMTLHYGPGWTWAWVQVRTDGGTIVLSMVSTGPDIFTKSWLVNSIAPADQAPTTTPPGKA